MRSRQGMTARARNILLGTVLSPLALAISQQTLAGDFEWGEVSGRYNGSLSAGAIWGAEGPNNDYINQRDADSIGYGSAGQFNPSGARTIDDSRLNYRKRGEMVSSPVTLLGEVELNWRNYGAFVRGKAWYDYSLSNDSVDYGHSANGYQHDSKLDDSRYDELAQFQGVSLLDAYVFGDFEFGDNPLHARLGNQVVNWGEGLFFQNGINSVNPIDVASLRRPGSQLKEALLPVPIAYFNLGLTDALSMEAFYQLKWRKTVLEGCGTYFAANDYVTGTEGGCYGVPFTPVADDVAYANDLILHRGKDNDPRDEGQFGVAFRYFADSIGTEFGAYAMNIHSRTPFASVITDSHATPGAGWRPGQQASNVQYFADFPEDIRIYGLSFSTNVLGTSVFGEYSYRPNQPIQLATGDLIPAFALLGPGLINALQPTLGQDALNAAPGSVYNGYDRREISQFSLGFIRSFPQVLGANNLSLIGEAGAKYVHDLPGLDERRYVKGDLYGTDFADGSAAGCAAGTPAQYQKYACSRDGNATEFSWGYRLRAQLDYSGLFAGVNVSPYVAFGHDVKGWSHDGNFVEDRLMGSVGVKADYLQKYSAEMSWSGSGNTPFAPTDRDFLALSLRMGF